MEPVVDNNNNSNNNNSSCESSFYKEDEKVEAMDLLEECWFFENMLNITRPKMSRCYSDPYPSSTGLISPDFLVKEPQKNGDSVHAKKIQGAPSMPPLRDREGSSSSTRSKLVKGNHHHRSECSSSSSSRRRKSKLLRTPSLPPSIGREEKFQESDHRNGRSHKQPSTPTHVDILPPRQTYKSCSIPRYRPARNNNIEVESTSTQGIKEMRIRYLNQKTMRRSLSDLELEEVQGFKDLGFSFEKEALSPSLASIIPGLQDKNREETEEDKAARGPYLSEAWLVQSCGPPLPPPPPPIISNWAPKKYSASDMKEQIKFWARAVASNVHQEC